MKENSIKSSCIHRHFFCTIDICSNSVTRASALLELYWVSAASTSIHLKRFHLLKPDYSLPSLGTTPSLYLSGVIQQIFAIEPQFPFILVQPLAAYFFHLNVSCMSIFLLQIIHLRAPIVLCFSYMVHIGALLIVDVQKSLLKTYFIASDLCCLIWYLPATGGYQNHPQ